MIEVIAASAPRSYSPSASSDCGHALFLSFTISRLLSPLWLLCNLTTPGLTSSTTPPSCFGGWSPTSSSVKYGLAVHSTSLAKARSYSLLRPIITRYIRFPLAAVWRPDALD